jgi:hypothetical protein
VGKIGSRAFLVAPDCTRRASAARASSSTQRASVGSVPSSSESSSSGLSDSESDSSKWRWPKKSSRSIGQGTFHALLTPRNPPRYFLNSKAHYYAQRQRRHIFNALLEGLGACNIRKPHYYQNTSSLSFILVLVKSQCPEQETQIKSTKQTAPRQAYSSDNQLVRTGGHSPFQKNFLVYSLIGAVSQSHRGCIAVSSGLYRSLIGAAYRGWIGADIGADIGAVIGAVSGLRYRPAPPPSG